MVSHRAAFRMLLLDMLPTIYPSLLPGRGVREPCAILEGTVHRSRKLSLKMELTMHIEVMHILQRFVAAQELERTGPPAPRLNWCYLLFDTSILVQECLMRGQYGARTTCAD